MEMAAKAVPAAPASGTAALPESTPKAAAPVVATTPVATTTTTTVNFVEPPKAAGQ